MQQVKQVSITSAAGPRAELSRTDDLMDDSLTTRVLKSERGGGSDPMSAGSTSAGATATVRFFISPDVRSTTGKDGTTILNISKGTFYSLIGLSSMTWARLAVHPEGLTFDAIIEELQEGSSNLSRQQIAPKLMNLLNDLTRKGVVQVGRQQAEPAEARREQIVSAMASLFRLVTNPLITLKLCTLVSFLYLGLFQLVGKVWGFQERRAAVKRWPTSPRQANDPEAIAKLREAMTRACTWFPWLSRCLQHSTAMTCLLRQHGFPAQMVIGVRKMPFSSHAWVEVEGVVVNDHEGVRKYFTVLDRW